MDLSAYSARFATTPACQQIFPECELYISHQSINRSLLINTFSVLHDFSLMKIIPQSISFSTLMLFHTEMSTSFCLVQKVWRRIWMWTRARVTGQYKCEWLVSLSEGNTVEGQLWLMPSICHLGRKSADHEIPTEPTP